MAVKNTLGDLHNILMEEMERLVAVDDGNLASEVDRARAMCGVSSTIMANAKTIIDVARVTKGLDMRVPRMLSDGTGE